MNPESITIKGIDKTDVMALMKAANWVLEEQKEWHATTSDYSVKITCEAIKQLIVRLARMMLNNRVKSMKLNRMEYNTVLIINEDLFNSDLMIGIRDIVEQIDRKI